MNFVRKIFRRLKPSKKFIPYKANISSQAADQPKTSNKDKWPEIYKLFQNFDSRDESIYEKYRNLNCDLSFSEYRNTKEFRQLPFKKLGAEFNMFMADYNQFLKIVTLSDKSDLKFKKFPSEDLVSASFEKEAFDDTFEEDFKRFLAEFKTYLMESPNERFERLTENFKAYLEESLNGRSERSKDEKSTASEDHRVGQAKKDENFSEFFFNLCALFTVLNHPLKEKLKKNLCENKSFIHGIFCSKRRRCSRIVFPDEEAILMTIVTGWFNDIELRLLVDDHRGFYRDKMNYETEQILEANGIVELVVAADEDATAGKDSKDKANSMIMFPWQILVMALKRLNIFKNIIGSEK